MGHRCTYGKEKLLHRHYGRCIISGLEAGSSRATEISILRFPLCYAYIYRLQYIFPKETQIMPAIEVGRICVKQAGRECCTKCVIIDVMDKSYVLVTGPKKLTGIKRRRVNINHLMPLEDKIDIKRGASDDEVSQALDATGKTAEMTQPL
jgi:large subunit ribosomal protein L14e